mmetsp:Transcript_8506/g.34324  ORF Transcript_8506/g.34324 Transcript_8506/m.34324 type:complete len:214 (+) Transcript_8506:468-1109(+)
MPSPTRIRWRAPDRPVSRSRPGAWVTRSSPSSPQSPPPRRTPTPTPPPPTRRRRRGPNPGSDRRGGNGKSPARRRLRRRIRPTRHRGTRTRVARITPSTAATSSSGGRPTSSDRRAIATTSASSCRIRNTTAGATCGCTARWRADAGPSRSARAGSSARAGRRFPPASATRPTLGSADRWRSPRTFAASAARTRSFTCSSPPTRTYTRRGRSA